LTKCFQVTFLLEAALLSTRAEAGFVALTWAMILTRPKSSKAYWQARWTTAYNHRVLEAFFVEGQDIGDIGVLTKLAGEVGLDQKEFEEALRSRKYREIHRQALRHAYDEAGVTGVPMLVIGNEVLTGLQDKETLEAVIEKAAE